ncbi:hypothetical protein K432DRAFT_140352 [Lepidopterella palustris CBS 459.81]|uniref:Uncharacterized protein n=1 Tax=Lepidopterella palustris CBS 459.81 TaxID=1314670 RepID=A0A8E2JIR9_9PEZI|nr:hypothetical protein K432DRAFT_140352 [Lepidopterella palustris CBS 459.81]
MTLASICFLQSPVNSNSSTPTSRTSSPHALSTSSLSRSYPLIASGRHIKGPLISRSFLPTGPVARFLAACESLRGFFPYRHLP